jgi:hypothetical protein
MVRATSALACLGLSAIAGVLTACSSSSSKATPSASPEGSGCVSDQQAKQIWTQVDDRLNAVELDPKNSSPADVATGTALMEIQQYLQQTLVAHNLTEREVDKLQSIKIVDAGCNAGTLKLQVTMTLVQDDYLAADGHVDHADMLVGQTLHTLQSYVRSGGTWRESDFQSLDQPPSSATPQLV